ncbi:MAG: PEP-CTERM sorting domain-containing protein [Planctomycetota bacterium]
MNHPSTPRTLFGSALAAVGSLAFVSHASAALLIENPGDLTQVSNVTSAGSGGNAGFSNADNFTLNITFTPTADDLTGSVRLFEVGAESNGTGLFLIDGVPVFVSKANSGATQQSNAWSPSTNDLSFENNLGDDTVAVNFSGGSLTAGVETSIALVYNTPGSTEAGSTLVLAVDADGDTAINPVIDNFTFTDFAGNVNFFGNNTVGFGQANSNTGGENTNGTADAFSRSVLENLDGELTQGTLWKGVGTVIIPEPSSLGLIGLGSLLVVARQRRHRD